MSDIDRHGVHRVMKKALARVTDGTDYVHVSFDLDAVDPDRRAWRRHAGQGRARLS